MLVTLDHILKKAESGNYAVVAPDYTTMHSLRYILEVAETHHAPVILSYTKHVRALCPTKSWGKWIQIIRDECGQYGVEVCLHLDHGTTVPECIEAINSGFTGVMIDASAHTFDENVNFTREVVELAHRHNVSVESELGHVGEAVEGSYLMKDDARAHLTDPQQAKRFVELTKTDCLAVAIGTVHGEYKGEPDIAFHLLVSFEYAEGTRKGGECYRGEVREPNGCRVEECFCSPRCQCIRTAGFLEPVWKCACNRL